MFAFIRAIVVRTVFHLYCFVAAWRVVVSYESPSYWLLLGLLSGLIIETHITIRINKGQEWKWFSPAIFFFLFAALPCLWLLELQLMKRRQEEAQGINYQQLDHTIRLAEQNTWFGVKLPTQLDEFGWALALEQSLLLILICCRGILPRGKISRDELSQILLVHMGMAADILELFTIFKEDKIVLTPAITFTTLFLWTLSLLQYSLVITSSRSRKTRFAGFSFNGEYDSSLWGCSVVQNDRRQHFKKSGCYSSKFWSNKDVVGVLSTTAMQDLPFFIFRIFLLSGMGVVSHTMIFFTCKNALVVLLQAQRLHTIHSEFEDDCTEKVGAELVRHGVTVAKVVKRRCILNRLSRRKNMPASALTTVTSNLSLSNLTEIRSQENENTIVEEISYLEKNV